MQSLPISITSQIVMSIHIPGWVNFIQLERMFVPSASGITGANLAFDHKTKFNDGQPDGFYFAEVYFSFSSSNYFVICTVVLL
jgi:hypothetical protein